MWDLFISHASEDKNAVVVPLVNYLERDGLKIWVDYKELLPGDSLRQRIDEGLAMSRYGLLVVSENFFAKRWPRREMDGLFALDRDTSDHLIPIWHEISSERVTKHSPLLAGRLAILTDRGIKRTAREVAATIRRRDAPRAEDKLLEQLIAAYDEVSDHDGRMRVQRKKVIRDSMMELASKIRNIAQYATHTTEGGRLAYAAVLRSTPRRTELFRLIDTCRRTKHRFIWIEACLAIARHVEVCKTTEREQLQAADEVEALRHRPLFKRSAAVRGATEQTTSRLRARGKSAVSDRSG